MEQKDKKVHTFPIGFKPKVNITERPEFEPAYNDVTVQLFNHYDILTLH